MSKYTGCRSLPFISIYPDKIRHVYYNWEVINKPPLHYQIIYITLCNSWGHKSSQHFSVVLTTIDSRIDWSYISCNSEILKCIITNRKPFQSNRVQQSITLQIGPTSLNLLTPTERSLNLSVMTATSLLTLSWMNGTMNFLKKVLIDKNVK
jgi:hypothetical protein